MQLWHTLFLEITAILGMALMIVTIPWVLMTKRDATSAVAWCLLVFFLPIFGSLLFLMFGYQHVHRPLSRKRLHKVQFRLTNPSCRQAREAEDGDGVGVVLDSTWSGMIRLATRFGAFPVTSANRVVFYYEGQSAFRAKLEAIHRARHHVHLEYFIIQPDGAGQALLDLLTVKARQGVEIRLLHDYMGTHRPLRKKLAPLLAAGGKCRAFLPLNPFRRRIQVNLRDHRKILVVDGRIAFTGGLNIGDEYLGKKLRFGFWRDTHLRIEGPAAADLQRVFIEGWDFAAEENLQGDVYFPEPIRVDEAEPGHGADEENAREEDGFVSSSRALACPVQVIPSGPDQDMKGIREIYFAAVLRARKRLWIASPYFVPDAGLLDALCLAAYSGVDVRLLCQFHPDKWLPFFAGRYYWSAVLEAGVKVYQYMKGMMHAKVILADDEWASVGTANLDNRSLHLNFEVNCLFYSGEVITELEEMFQRDLRDSVQLDRNVFAHRPFAGRLVDNACRLMSAVL